MIMKYGKYKRYCNKVPKLARRKLADLRRDEMLFKMLTITLDKVSVMNITVLTLKLLLCHGVLGHVLIVRPYLHDLPLRLTILVEILVLLVLSVRDRLNLRVLETL